MTGPLVGVVAHHHVVPRPFGPLPVVGTPTAYADSVGAAGGRGVLLPPGQALDLLGVVDAVVLTGGGDLDPAAYGGRSPAAVDVDPARDAVELDVARAAVSAGLPLLGVCRGLQVLAVAFGGVLHDVEGHLDPTRGHEVHTATGSLVAGLVGAHTRTTALHHQAVARPGPGWRVTAWTDDGVAEALEPLDPGLPVLGVQWHPELAHHAVMQDPTGAALFGWLVDEARQARAPGRRVVRHDRPLVAGTR